MTPAVAVGGGASPLTTWGEVDGTPLVLLDPKDLDPTNKPIFHLKDQRPREELALKIEVWMLCTY
ncbi:unnamed protein product [Heterosigma akashiwo]